MTAPDPNAPAAPPARPARFARLQAATDRVPTKWLAGIGTALFLTVTAAFGGLNTVAASEVPHIIAGEQHVNDRAALTVQRAVLLDTFAEAGAYADPDKGERVLALLVDAENRWDRADAVQAAGGLASTITVTGLDAAPASVARLDDAAQGPWLQPGVPASLVFTWIVPGDLFASGDEIEVVLSDQKLSRGSVIVDGEYWGEPQPAAVVTVSVDDRGAGS